MSSGETAIPKDATQLVAEWLKDFDAPSDTRAHWADYQVEARDLVATLLPVLRRHIADETLRWAADVIHREAVWQKESQMRGMFANGETSIERVLMLEHIMRNEVVGVVRDGDT